MEKKLNFEQAKNKALRFLEYRAHSEKEMCEKLKRAGTENDDIERVIDFLKEYRLINDEEFALKCAKDLKNLKKLGKKRVKMELIKKGISSETAENVIEELEWDEEDMLYSLVRKKLEGNFERKCIERCMRYFVYKGYGYEDIKSVIEKIQAEEEYGI